MARQRCCGLVEEEPLCRRFRAEGGEETVILGVDELEAIRLKDAVGLDQESCASQMGLSRPTFQRLLAQARRKQEPPCTMPPYFPAIRGAHFALSRWEPAPHCCCRVPVWPPLRRALAGR